MINKYLAKQWGKGLQEEQTRKSACNEDKNVFGEVK